MDKFCVITNAEKDRDYETASRIQTFLREKGKTCLMVRDRFIAEDIGKYAEISEIPDDTECIIVLGGDGTMIRAANDLHNKNIPFLGVNLGTLGFLTEVEKQDIRPALEDLFQDRYRVEKRIMLEGRILENRIAGTALNDFVICKSQDFHLIELKVYVNGEYIDTYVADGLIVSTPTGSTGYNLSAGGPVLSPELKAIIITPICPHSLNKRSLVAESESRICIQIGRSKTMSEDKAVIFTDGNAAGSLKTGESVEIIQSAHTAKIIKLTGCSFFEKMRNKLNRGS